MSGAAKHIAITPVAESHIASVDYDTVQMSLLYTADCALADCGANAKLALALSNARGWKMRSKLAEQARKSLQEAIARLTPTQRLEAYFRHSKAMIELRTAGEKLRQRRRDSQP